MNLHLLAFLGLALVVGVAVGYYLRLIIALGQKGSMELEIKKILISAKEEAQRITDEAKKRPRSVTKNLKKKRKIVK